MTPAERFEPPTQGVRMDIFDDTPSSPEPTFVLLIGGPGSAPLRASARLSGEYGNQIAVLDDSDLAALGGFGANGARDYAEQARLSRRSIVVTLLSPDEGAEELLSTFAKDEYKTHVVVVAGREVQDLLAIVSATLREADYPSLGPVDAFDKGWSTTRAFVDVVSTGLLAQRVTVLDGDGNVAFDGPGDDAAAAMDAARSQPMSNLQSVAWLGELRRLMEYALSSERGSLSTSERQALKRLHELALVRVLPQLPIRQDGPVAAAQRASLIAQRNRLAQEPQLDGPDRTTPLAPSPATKDLRGI
jgi:hypothetical protein